MGKIYRQYMYAYPHKTAYYPLEREQILPRLAALAGEGAALYLHVPFCESKCGYCNLFSVAGSGDLIPAYVSAVKRQLAQYAQTVDLRSVRFHSLVIGGGTPVLLPRSVLQELLNALEEACGVTPDQVDSCIELAPNQTTPESIAYLREAGFRRVSVGVQSLHDEELRALGRTHSAKRCAEVLPLLSKAGFPVWNLDLIYGLPGQTWATLGDSLRQAIRFTPTEIFLYPLYVKPHTPLYGRIKTDEAKALALYHQARALLLERGYTQTSMRRFTRQPPKSTEPSCGFEQNLAIGCGGRSYLGNLHFCEPFAVEPAACAASLRQFCQKEDFLSGVVGWVLDADEQKRRYAVKNLLYNQGISIEDYHRHFGSGPVEDFAFLPSLLERGLAVCAEGRLRLTPEGLAYSDAIGPLFISPSVAARSAEFYMEGRMDK